MKNILTTDRRKFISLFATLGLSSTLLPGVLWAQLQEKKTHSITKEMLEAAEHISGVHFTDAQREKMLEWVNNNHALYEQLHEVDLGYDVAPALHFNPILPGMMFSQEQLPIQTSIIRGLTRPNTLEELAFWNILQLADLIKTRQVSSLELTKMYLTRLRKHGPLLNCVVTITEDLALEQAVAADAEIAEGKYRGLLHGLPWGAKDIISKKGYPTTWGASPFKEQHIDYDATVVNRLEEAGAVLVAKLSTGELAYSDTWFSGQTKNPWDVGAGSGGSSAGPASATAAGLVAFSIGTETGGSIVEPAIKCGVTGLRPTFGRVSRHGVMPGAWSFDKVGPICRSAEDCALVLHEIHGKDDVDMSVIKMPFNWNATAEIKTIRIGYLKAAFDEEHALPEEKSNDAATLHKLRQLGFDLKPVELPQYPIHAVTMVCWYGEVGSVWDQFIRTGQDALLAVQGTDGIGNLARMARTAPAVDAVTANRIRTLLMQAAAKIFEEVDVYVAPFSSTDNTPPIAYQNLQLTNLTGHPAVTVPNGFTNKGTPTGITFIGNLFGEASLLAIAKAYQDDTDFHKKHPKEFI
ncbi:Asp-tRNAAsn/Glu-tRNAGln amidotransferase A subunit [Flavobacteriaceae bacterium MAR_2010_188]|nr:Asp-tRNAAsn/Glu-tRNAGln amidotransferase A subunit [Flavobacteriaceae bacterium MAR_2010_188]